MKFFQCKTFHARVLSLIRTRCLSYSTANEVRDLRICIVGAGPAGLYTADRILKQFKNNVKIDVIDRLPFPFGLVATGVAPDHPSTKNVIKSFTKTLLSPQCTFYGGVQVGRQIPLSILRDMYHGVVLAYGAEGDKKLNVSGEDGNGVLTAREFVWWYNGHPDFAKFSVPLENVKSVAIVGAGNVALDCARILLKPWTEFRQTDMAPRALEKLKESTVEDVYIIVRRSAAHVNFTPKELREIFSLKRIRYDLDSNDLKLSRKEVDYIIKFRHRKRNQDIYRKALAEESEARFNQESFDRTLHFLFKKKIKKIELNQDSWIHNIQLEDTSGFAINDASLPLKIDLLITSLGNRGTPIDGVAFDDEKGIVPNIDGRILQGQDSREIEKGLYVSGWLKRGASGIIGTNIVDAEEVTHCLYIDAPSLLQTSLNFKIDLAEILKEKAVAFMRFEKWKQ